MHLQLPCEENFRRSPGCLPDFRERACVLRSGRELPEKKQSRKKNPAVCFQPGRVIDSMVTRQGTPLVRAGDEIKKARNWFPGSWTSPMTARRSSAMHMFRQMRIFTSDIPLPITIPFRWTWRKRCGPIKRKQGFFFQLGNWFLDFSSPLKQNEERLVSREPLFSIGIFRSPVTLGIAAIGSTKYRKSS